MHVSAEVAVSNRGLAQHNIKSNRKAARSVLKLGKKPKPSSSQSSSSSSQDERKDEIFLLHCTNQNSAGTKYPAASVEKVFDRFAGEGRATIRIGQPQHDLLVSKADPVALKAFLGALKKVLAGDSAALDKLSLSALQPATTAQLAKPVTTLVVERKQDYPITKSFPSELESLTVTRVMLKKVDTRIFKLRHLSSLYLEDNSLTRIPVELGDMRHLRELNLSHNKIEKLPPLLLRRLHRLRVLKLGHNKIADVPNEICFLTSLTYLDLSDNALARIPLYLERLKRLDSLLLAGNRLTSLPACLKTFKNRSLLSLDRNPLPPASPPKVLMDTVRGEPAPLLDLCLGALLRDGFDAAEQAIPPSLKVAYDGWLRCFKCGGPVFGSRVVEEVPLDLAMGLSGTVVVSSQDMPGVVPSVRVAGPCCGRNLQAT